MARSRFCKTLIIMLGAGVLIAPAFAHAQSARDLNNRIQRLENEIQTLSRAIYRGETPPPPSGGVVGGSAATQAQLEVRLQQMESELRNMRGTLEEQDFEIRQLKKQIELMTSDVDMRLKDLEGGNSAAGGFSNNTGANGTNTNAPYTSRSSNGNTSVPYTANTQNGSSMSNGGNTLGTIREGSGNSSANGSVSVGKNPASQYEHAFSMLKASNYEAAEQEFSQFLVSHPDHNLSGNAKYWLGETYYVRGNYEQAARVFAEAYQQYPDSAKAPDNLLKLGMSLASSGNKSDACVALRQLEKQYPNGSGPVLRRGAQEMSKLGC